MCFILGQLAERGVNIVRDNSTIIRDRQLAIRRELDRRQIPLKIVAYDSGIPYNTLCSYFPGGERHPAEMPCSAVYSLCGVLPDDLLNLLCPEGYAVVRVPAGIDFDEISGACRSFIDCKEQAHHPESEAGRDIGPNEHQELAVNVVRLRA
jgi:hypothetical protein